MLILEAIAESRQLAKQAEDEDLATRNRLLQLFPPHYPALPPTPQDGSCFFHALAHHIRQESVTGETLRAAVCDFMQNTTQVFKFGISNDKMKCP